MDSKDEIKQKTDLVELISEYVKLKPAGNFGHKGLCPFHGEKTPSFHVSGDKQIWHCFGCSEGGDCFSFVQKMEGMTFPEALEHLGRKCGVEVKRFSSKEGNVRQRMLAVNDLAEKFFVKVLNESSKAQYAREYVASRQIPQEIAAKFGLGYAPDDWSLLCDVLRKRGYSEAELVQAGVALKKRSGSGVIDRFRHRLMIPLRDQHGNTLGFTGRVLRAEDNPKYMNSPETPVYSKGRVLFGLDVAKQAIKQAGYVVIVEGNLDVTASHKAGVEQVVASSGTALTQDQLELLKRYTDTIVFAFDSDAAGFKAVKKGLAIARGLGLDVRAAILPEGVKDPDELVEKNPAAWKELVEHSVPIMQFLISHVTRGKDLRNVDDKRAVSAELLPALGQMTDVVEREHWLVQVADLLAVKPDVLRSSISVKGSVVSGQGTASVDPAGEKSPKLSKDEQAYRLIFGQLVNAPELFEMLHKRFYRFVEANELWTTLYNLAQEAYDSDSLAAQTTFFTRLRDRISGHQREQELLPLLDSSSLLAESTFQTMSPQQVLAHVEDLLAGLSKRVLKRDRTELARQLRQAEQAGDQEQVQALLARLSD